MHTDPTDIPQTPDALRALRDSLERSVGAASATRLQEVGFAAGAGMLDALDRWCSRQGHGHPEAMGVSRFRAALTAFLAESGWGAARITTLAEGIECVEATGWAEADVTRHEAYPACGFTAGLLADLLGRVGDAPMACLEVTCASCGDDACRFLVGSPEMLGAVHARMAEGLGYRDAVAAVA